MENKIKVHFGPRALRSIEKSFINEDDKQLLKELKSKACYLYWDSVEIKGKIQTMIDTQITIENDIDPSTLLKLNNLIKEGYAHAIFRRKKMDTPGTFYVEPLIDNQ